MPSKKTTMTVLEMKEIIKGLPYDMPIGGVGHLGEFLDCLDVGVREVHPDRYSMSIRKPILSICLEDAGEEPD